MRASRRVPEGWVACLFTCLLAVPFALTFQSAPPAAADEAKKEDKAASVDGVWKWSRTGRDGQTQESTLTLKQEGEKLTGKITSPRGDAEISDGTFKDGVVAFTVTRERDGRKFTMKYEGKLEGDTIKGKSSFDRDGQSRERDWEAKRAKEKE